MATSKSKSASGQNQGSKPKYLGVKLYDGQKVKPGQVIIRQRGTKFMPGKNVKKGRDDTLYSVTEGVIRFQTKRIRGFDDRPRKKKIVNVI